MMIIDRFEGAKAVLETDDGMMDVDRALLPGEAREGDVLIEKDGSFTLSRSAAAERRSLVRRKLRRLIRKNDD